VLRADLRRFYTLNLDDALAGEVGPPSALWDLVFHLPAGSALQRVVDPDWMWDQDAHLQATLVDELRFLRFELRRMMGGSKERRAPDPIERPGVTPPKDKSVYGGKSSSLPMDEMAGWLGGGFELLN
jgi:hypothetical protein